MLFFMHFYGEGLSKVRLLLPRLYTEISLQIFTYMQTDGGACHLAVMLFLDE